MKVNKMSVILASLIVVSGASANQYVTQQDFDELTKVVEKIETKSMVDRINFTPELQMRMDSFSYSMGGIDANGDGVLGAGEASSRDNAFPQTKKWDPAYSVRFKLNMASELTSNVKFNGTVQITHNTQSSQRICILSPQAIGDDLHGTSSDVPTAVDVTRAYFDVALNKSGVVPYYFSFGILPTSGGASSNVVADASRKSVFPSLMFDSNAYGAIATADVSKVVGLDKTFVRAIAAKAYTLNAGQFYYQCNRETIQNMEVAGLFVETSLPFAFLGNNTVYVGANLSKDIKATPYLGPATSSLSNSTMGDILNYGMGIQAEKIGGTGLTAFLNIATSHPSPSGETQNYLSYSRLDPTTASPYASGEMLSEDGHALHVGGKYEFASTGTQIGAEYNKGSKYWWSATQGADDVFNKLATRGSVYEVYVNQMIVDGVQARVGYFQIQEDYTGSGWHFGEPATKDGLQKNLYVTISTKF